MQFIGGLKTICRPAREETSTAIVLKHGYGADSQDLVPLSSYLDPERKFNWYFPQGRLEVKIAPGLVGYGWFPIDQRFLEQVMGKGNHRRDLSDTRPPGFSDAVEFSTNFYENLTQSYDKVIVGGFSQGAMISLGVSLMAPSKNRIVDLIQLSGHIVEREHVLSLMKNRSPLRFFQSHGRYDSVLPLSGGQALYQSLTESGHQGSWNEFSGGHEIPLSILEQLKKFLNL